jgi:formate hydrogenlyase subunit 6/NADH:ubiquinone oxidoreductase subunit I
MLKTIKKMLTLLFTRQDITELYPDPIAKPILPKRAKGFLSVDTYKCDLCADCVKICPSNSIGINKNSLSLRINYATCLSCGYCTRTCPENAILFSKEFEGATKNSDFFIHEFNIINVRNIKKENL